MDNNFILTVNLIDLLIGLGIFVGASLALIFSYSIYKWATKPLPEMTEFGKKLLGLFKNSSVKDWRFLAAYDGHASSDDGAIELIPTTTPYGFNNDLNIHIYHYNDSGYRLDFKLDYISVQKDLNKRDIWEIKKECRNLHKQLLKYNAELALEDRKNKIAKSLAKIDRKCGCGTKV